MTRHRFGFQSPFQRKLTSIEKERTDKSARSKWVQIAIGAATMLRVRRLFYSLSTLLRSMLFSFSGLNWWAILVATLAGFMLGGLWYGPIFGKAWLRAVGKRDEDLGNPAFPMSLSFFTAFATSLLMALLIGELGTVETALEGALLGLYIGVGFIAAAMASDYAFCRWPKELFFIQAGYRVVYSVIMGAILAGWR